MQIMGRQRAAGVTERERRLDLMAAIPELAWCTRAELAYVDERATEVQRPAGTVLQAEGQVLRQAAIVLDGSVEDRSGSSVRRSHGTGHLVGAAGFDRARVVASSTVVATTPVRLLVFGPTELGDLAEVAGIRAWATGAGSAPARVSVSSRRRARALTPALG